MILGTAGHIDHGKTALIRALTGVDTDRLPEEKARGITIDLGFAPLDLAPDLRVGVVDVPGHEALVRTMVAGASGIDLVLLVVAADEGVMPQTREHVAICELLGIERGVVALSKADLVDADVLALAGEEVRELLAPTPLAGAPLLPVSALSGDGLDALRAALLETARAAPARTPRSGPPRLPVDRAFAAHGFGTVATGTLVGAPLATGESVEVFPTGLVARVRGLQRHGAAVERVDPGSRCAVNLQGVDVSALPRGRVVAAPGSLAPTRTLDVALVWLPGSPALGRDGAAVAFLSGTAERVGRLAPIGADAIGSGERGLARVHLDGEPLALLPGDRFVVRGFSRGERWGATLGGGRVLDVAPPHRRRSDPTLRRELETLRDQPDAASGVALRVERQGFAGAEAAALARETGLLPETLADVLAALEAQGRLARAGERWLAGRFVGQLEERLVRALGAFHAREPLRPGMPRAALLGALPENLARGATDLLLERLAAAGRIVAEGELVRDVAHAPQLSPEQEKLVEQILEGSRAAGLEPPTLREWSERLRQPPESLRALLVHLEQRGELVRTRGELWFDRAAVEALRRRVVEHIRSQGPLDTPSYKQLIGTTRKHAVPLMELLDAQRVTLRKGDARILRGDAGD